MDRLPRAVAAAVSDQGVPSRYSTPVAVDRRRLEEARSTAVETIDSNLEGYCDRFPTPSSTEYRYGTVPNTNGWTQGFWTGLCWLAYEITGTERFRRSAQAQLETFDRRLESGAIATHDLGFLYTLSAVAGHQLTGTPAYRSTALSAANLLCDRFLPAPGMIQAWDSMDDPRNPDNQGRMIADTMMNLPLLYWASETTGNDDYQRIADTHARTNAATIVRADGSTFHTFDFDVASGEPLMGGTHQGHATESCWSRGQAWQLYGYAIAAAHTGQEAYTTLACKLANYYLDALPEDHVPHWDFDAPAEPGIRDSSAAAIAVCGLDTLSRVLALASEQQTAYRNAALATLDSLAASYTTPATSNGLLTDGAYNTPEDDYDECTIWGDYFFVEGLCRATKTHRPFWY
ncbi:glycoside hydrolase family 88 protein [Halocatena halophila]|uniref:glycoside hydrolase family 88 protein n=1 Tax=Halocatena halophila TaxID=2814576 RepID=UPI002ED40DA9